MGGGGGRETREENKWKQNFRDNFGDLQRTLKWIMEIQDATTEKMLKIPSWNGLS